MKHSPQAYTHAIGQRKQHKGIKQELPHGIVITEIEKARERIGMVERMGGQWV